MAPSTPPPPSSDVFAAMTMASTRRRVLSPTTISSATPFAAAARWRRGCMRNLSAASSAVERSCRFLLQVEGGALADGGEVLLEKLVGGVATDVAEQQEERALDGELGARGELLHVISGDDAVQSGAVDARLAAPAQKAAVDELADHADGAEFRQQRGVEGDLVDAVEDIARRLRRVFAFHRIGLHQKDVVGARGAEQRKQRRIADVAAVPIGLSIDLDGVEQKREAGGRHHHVGGDLVAAEDAHLAGTHIGGGDEQLDRVALAHRLEVDHALDDLLQWR